MCEIASVGRHRRYNTAINIRLVYEPINNDSYYGAWSVAETKWSVSRRRRDRARGDLNSFIRVTPMYGCTGSFKTVLSNACIFSGFRRGESFA